LVQRPCDDPYDCILEADQAVGLTLSGKLRRHKVNSVPWAVKKIHPIAPLAESSPTPQAAGTQKGPRLCEARFRSAAFHPG
jgi:hypothetical protein